jgi:hypothetical protein
VPHSSASALPEARGAPLPASAGASTGSAAVQMAISAWIAEAFWLNTYTCCVGAIALLM